MSKITSLRAREILDSRGNPTVEVNRIESKRPSCYYAVDEVSVVLERLFVNSVDELKLHDRRFVAFRVRSTSCGFSPEDL